MSDEPGLSVCKAWGRVLAETDAMRVLTQWEHSKVVFTPYDSFEILTDRKGIGRYIANRNSRSGFSTDWKIMTTLTVGDIVLVTAELTLGLSPIDGGPIEKRNLFFTAAAKTGANGRVRFRHVAEAAPAFILAVISDYRAEGEIGEHQ